MKLVFGLGLGCLACCASAQQSAPALAVDAAAAQHPISPYIYGVNSWQDNGLQEIMRIPLLRFGGNEASSYNWKLGFANKGGDWYFESYTPAAGAPTVFDALHEHNLQAGTITLGTVPILAWTPKVPGGGAMPSNAMIGCSFSVAKYGAQKNVDSSHPDCGNGVSAATGANIVNDPNDMYQPLTPAFVGEWVSSVKSTYGPSNLGGVRLWSLDNEPEYWDGLHADIYHQYASYDDMLSRGMATAQAVKAADPTALVTGPVPAGWSGMLFSSVDFHDGYGKSPWQYWDNPLDYQAHGSVYWVPYYLQQMSQFEQKNGYRLLDVLDVHGYVAPWVMSGSAGDAAMETMRMTSTRALWDPNYYPPSGGFEDATGAEQAPALVPRMRQWVADNYPGTKTAITEYNWGAENAITGGIAQADILGIFGREQLDYATVWSAMSPTNPAGFALKMYLNYDGAGGHFGDTSVSATSDNPDALSIFAAKRYDSALTVMVLNKTSAAIGDSIALANFSPAGSAQVWQYSSANLNAVVRQFPDAGVSGSGLSMSFPAQSITLLVIPQAQSAMTVPQPVVSAVSSAASYDKAAVSPGEIVAIWGTGLGPAAGVNLALDSNGMVETRLGGTEVFVNGNPAPLIYVSAGQIDAVVPYEVAPAASANVIVVYQGNASAPFAIPITATKPGIFTSRGTGMGQGAILNQGYTVNSASNPAARGSWIMIYATGEGVTTPPGVDGRVSYVNGAPTPTVPSAVACAATIGGQAANVAYCGEAPYFTAGVLQVNAQIPDSISPGSAVLLTIAVGGVASQDQVTVAVR